MNNIHPSLQVKVVVAVAALVLAVLASIITVNIAYQQRQMREDFQSSTNVLANTVYNSILYPMAIGDSETIKQQMAEIEKDGDSTRVHVFGFDKLVTYTSESKKIDKDLSAEINSPQLAKALNELLATGKVPGTGFDEEKDGIHYLSLLRPLLNEKRCHHCHGASRPVLGGVLISQKSESMFQALDSIRTKNILVGILGGLIILLTIFFLISKLVSRPIHQVISGLNAAVWAVSDASNETAAVSAKIARGTSSQASAIEETSSSLEEIFAMTRQSAENASRADQLMNDVERSAIDARDSMGQLTKSMEDISSASEKTQKIIKTIDEIAFQTNLLALNAAVEAARAGEVGAGFAVVAEEVRSLAKRAADAAKNTAALIEGNVKTIQIGADLTIRMGSEFTEVSRNISKVGNLVKEISSASQEQAQGIEQVNHAVADIDRVVQENAANAEQAATTSERMKNQSRHMVGFVNGLIALIDGRAKDGETGEDNEATVESKLERKHSKELHI